MKVLIRCDGSAEIGLGHVVRCLALADELHAVHGCDVTFAMRKSEVGIKMVREKFPVLIPHVDNDKFDYEAWMLNLVRLADPDVLVLDVRDGLNPNVIKKIKKLNVLVVDIDDDEKKRLNADLVFYPPVPQVREMNWNGFSGQLFSGWEWVMLKKDFSVYKKSRIVVANQVPKILVTMGGTDPKLMIFKVIDALNQIQKTEFQTDIVIGKGFSEKARLLKMLASSIFKVKVYENTSDMASLMTAADLSVCAFGVTAYELACLGVPAIHLCLTKDHAKSSESFSNAGIACGMGLYKDVKPDELSKKIESLLNSSQDRNQMRKAGLELVDASGTDNIAQKIISVIN